MIRLPKLFNRKEAVQPESLTTRTKAKDNWRAKLKLECDEQKRKWESNHGEHGEWNIKSFLQNLNKNGPESFWKNGKVSNLEGKITLKDLDLGNLFFGGIDFNGENLSGVSFFGSHMHHGNFSDAFLRKADFSQAELCNAKFPRADLRKASLVGTDVAGADFTGAKLPLESFFLTENRNKDFLKDATFYLEDGRQVVGLLVDDNGNPYVDRQYGETTYNLIGSFEQSVRDTDAVHFADIIKKVRDDEESHLVKAYFQELGQEPVLAAA